MPNVLVSGVEFDAILAAEAAVRYLNCESVLREIMLPVEIFDHANCAAWDMQFEARALPEWDAIIDKT